MSGHTSNLRSIQFIDQDNDKSKVFYSPSWHHRSTPHQNYRTYRGSFLFQLVSTCFHLFGATRNGAVLMSTHMLFVVNEIVTTVPDDAVVSPPYTCTHILTFLCRLRIYRIISIRQRTGTVYQCVFNVSVFNKRIDWRCPRPSRPGPVETDMKNMATGH